MSSKFTILFLLASLTSYPNVDMEDIFLYRIESSVYALSDLKKLSRYMEHFSCAYQDSVLVDYFKEFSSYRKSISELSVNKLKTNFKKSQTQKILRSYRELIRFDRYTETQDIKVSSNLKSAIIYSIEQNGCDKNLVNKNMIDKDFLNFLRLEILIRSRFLPQGANISDKRVYKTVLSAMESYSETLKKQLKIITFEL